MRPTDVFVIMAVVFATIGLVRTFSMDRTIYQGWKLELVRVRVLLEEETARRKEETRILSIDLERERFLRRSLEDHYDKCRRTMASVMGDAVPLVPYASPLPSRDSQSLVTTMLVNSFSMDELNQLMFDLGIGADSLPHDTVNMAARELVWFMERHGRFDELIDNVDKQRPHYQLKQSIERIN
jgi:hypothetical protein